MPSRAAIFGNCCGELGAHLAEMLQLEVVVLEEPRIHYDTRDGREVRDLDLAGFEVDLGPDQQLERHRLRPELTVNLDADDVVVIELAGVDQRLTSQRLGQDARLEIEDRLPDGALQIRHVERRGRLSRQRRQAEVDHRPAHRRQRRQIACPRRVGSC